MSIEIQRVECFRRENEAYQKKPEGDPNKQHYNKMNKKRNSKNNSYDKRPAEHSASVMVDP